MPRSACKVYMYTTPCRDMRICKHLPPSGPDPVSCALTSSEKDKNRSLVWTLLVSCLLWSTLRSVTPSGQYKYRMSPFFLFLDDHWPCILADELSRLYVWRTYPVKLRSNECYMLSPQCYMLSPLAFYMLKSSSCILRGH